MLVWFSFCGAFRTDILHSSDRYTTMEAMRLPEVLDITQARKLHADLLERIRSGMVQVDGSNVERITTPCVQIVLAAARDCDALGRPLRLRDASKAFIAALAELGLQAEFNKWMS